MKRTLIPNDFRDFLSIFSLLGFIGGSLFFLLGIDWISENTNGILLMLGGAGFLVIGKVITAKQWIKDGIQQNEISQLLAIIFGFSSLVIGILFLLGVSVSTKYYGFIGILLLVPAIYTGIDYIAKNKKR